MENPPWRRARALSIDYELHHSGRSRSTMAYLDELSAPHGARLHAHPKDEGLHLDFAALLAVPGPDTCIYACGPADAGDAGKLLHFLARRCIADRAFLFDHCDVVLTRSERDARNRMMACCSRARGRGRLVLKL